MYINTYVHTNMHAATDTCMHTYTYIFIQTHTYAHKPGSSLCIPPPKKNSLPNTTTYLCYFVINYIVALALRQHKWYLKWQNSVQKIIANDRWLKKWFVFGFKTKSQNKKDNITDVCQTPSICTHPGLRHLRKSALHVHVFSVYLFTGFISGNMLNATPWHLKYIKEYMRKATL